eukprot:1380698-Prymnesium_polylepis.1
MLWAILPAVIACNCDYGAAREMIRLEGREDLADLAINESDARAICLNEGSKPILNCRVALLLERIKREASRGWRNRIQIGVDRSI